MASRAVTQPGWLSAKYSRPRLHDPRPCPDSSAKKRLFCDETAGVAVSRAAAAINAWHRPPPPKPQRSKKEGRKIDSMRNTRRPKIAAARTGRGGFELTVDLLLVYGLGSEEVIVVALRGVGPCDVAEGVRQEEWLAHDDAGEPGVRAGRRRLPPRLLPGRQLGCRQDGGVRVVLVHGGGVCQRGQGLRRACFRRNGRRYLSVRVCGRMRLWFFF